MPKTSGPLLAEAAKSLHLHNFLDLSPPFPLSLRRVFCPGEQLPGPLGPGPQFSPYHHLLLSQHPAGDPRAATVTTKNQNWH